MKKYTYPKQLLPKGAKVILYGYGEIGKYVASRILNEEYCELVGIVDRNVDPKELPPGIAFWDLYNIENAGYDYILITSKVYEHEIYKTLSDIGVEKCKILFLQEEDRIIWERNDVPVMEIDKVEESHAENFGEYVRYRTLELICKEIYRKNLNGAVAEAGVYMGNFAKALSYCFPDKELYLYDTFSGFDKRDMDADVERGFTSERRFGSFTGKDIFAREDMTSEQQIEHIKKKLRRGGAKVNIRKGNFPESAVQEQDTNFCFVSLDMDLYRPTRDGLEFFWPRLVEGGIIFLHDYNAVEHKGVMTALEEFEIINGTMIKVPIPDQYGTVILVKSVT